jgi:hypothetical protein
LKRSLLVLTALFLIFTLAGQSVWAFSDTKNDPNESKIAELEKQGVLKGNQTGQFKPKDKLTYAEGIALIVRGMGLNIDNLRFIKEPKASDYFTKVNDNAWYAESFIIAFHNGLEVPKDVDPRALMTREQFAHHLFRAISAKGEYAFIELWVGIHDEADVTPAYMDSIQKLLIAKIAELDKKQNFYPKANITRSSAAAWLHDAMKFVKKQTPIPAAPEFPLTGLKLDVKAVNNDVNEVTVSAMAPNPGYGFKIETIWFDSDQAVIHIVPTYPKEDMMYPQVITEVKQVTYISSKYKPVLAEAGTGSASGTTGAGGNGSAGTAGAGVSGSSGADGSADQPVSTQAAS